MLRANRDEGLLQCCENETAETFFAYNKDCKLYFVEEQSRLKNIIQNDVQYILISHVQDFQARYFEENFAFKNIKTITENNPASGETLTVNIFEVRHAPESSGGGLPIVSPHIADFLSLFELRDPEAYRAWRQQVLIETMGASEDQIQAIREGRALAEVPCVGCEPDED